MKLFVSSVKEFKIRRQGRVKTQFHFKTSHLAVEKNKTRMDEKKKQVVKFRREKIMRTFETKIN